MLDLEPETDQSPPDRLEERHEDTAGQDHPHCQQGLALPVKNGVNEPITDLGTEGGSRGRQLLTPPPTDSCPSRRPVDEGEGGVVDTEDDGQIEVVDMDGSSRHHNIKYTGGSVDTVEEDI